MPRSRLLRPLLGCAAVAALVLAGGSDTKGIKVSGKVTFKGQAVATGNITFVPAAGKDSPGGQPGFAKIKDGSYSTGDRGSQGVVAGSNNVRIEGFDSAGKMLFVYTTSVDLPAESSTKDFDVPEAAAANVPKDAGGPAP